MMKMKKTQQRSRGCRGCRGAAKEQRREEEQRSREVFFLDATWVDRGQFANQSQK